MVKRIRGLPAFMLLAVLLDPGLLPAQQLVPTDTAGVYLLLYTDLDGIARSVRVEALNRVDAEIVTRETATSTGHRLEITLLNHASERGQQPIAKFELACPEVTSLHAPPGWNARRESHPRRGRICVFSARGEALAPGSAISGFVIEGRLAPGCATARVFGVAEAVLWPSESGTVPEAAVEIAGQLRGRTGGWSEVPTRALVGTRGP